MRLKHFLSEVEHQRVHDAIQSAEEGTSGDIVVYIARRRLDHPLTAAHDRFSRLRLGDAKDDNSLLILVAPVSHTFAVVGGKALHDKLGQKWWDDLLSVLRQHFRNSQYTDGLVAAIERAGQALKTHFPATNTDRTGQKDIVEE